MFALTTARIATFLSLSALAVSTGCSTDEKPSAPDDKSLVEAFLAEDSHAVGALSYDENGGYNFDVELATGKLVITVASQDDRVLYAPMTFDPSSMAAFVGRGTDFKIAQIANEDASHWITNAEAPALCSSRKLDSFGKVTFADGSQHDVSVGINYIKDKTQRIDVSNGGCPVPSKGAGACNGAKCELGVKIKGFDLVLSGSCQYGELVIRGLPIWRNCLCDVILPDLTEVELDEVQTTDLPSDDDGSGSGSGSGSGDGSGTPIF